MSQISTIYDTIYSAMTATFTGRKDLVDTYDLSKNDDQWIRSGYGVIIGSANNSGQLKRKPVAVERSIDIVLTNRVYGTERSSDARKVTEKLLLEDACNVTNMIKNNSTITRIVDNIEFENDNGIEQVMADKNNYLSIRINIIINYMENY